MFAYFSYVSSSQPTALGTSHRILEALLSVGSQHALILIYAFAKTFKKGKSL